MKFIPLFDEVTSALNFSSPACHVIGGCDLYTTKAAGSDKKLYRNIQNYLESQHRNTRKLSTSTSAPELDLSYHLLQPRPSPFGSLSQVSSRRIFAYLIATLNASHPDYDFSHVLRPADFCKEKSIEAVISTIDSTLNNLKPHSGGTAKAFPKTSYTATSLPNSHTWGPQMWSIIDKEMVLRDCSVYCWAPRDEPFDGDEGSIWSLNYFFFNKELKRVAYIHVRAIPATTPCGNKYGGEFKRCINDDETGAMKRARYWLGNRAADITNFEGVDQDHYDENLRCSDDDCDTESFVISVNSHNSCGEDTSVGYQECGQKFHHVGNKRRCINTGD
ncbi:BgTH12-00529 [Blumeria graminis f. sp. triticale]|uniref:Repressor of RNA polymerase III transcription MAF1 n=3 Tax=Blumeria graminis TaxID=34373 RepID=A0A381L9V5_BLUGR|nr:Negative regulator of RNA polymerase III [Blumeria graminis f. sp. tritici 96224]CAD6505030.1 BgTH12-00529 [Blumeria graminis f. sp. triticale]VDB93038.1 Bgt-3331 [Blumeria graminis f. sp. tritici]